MLTASLMLIFYIYAIMSLYIPNENYLEAEGLIHKAYVRSRRTDPDLLLVHYRFLVDEHEYFGETVVMIPSENKDKVTQLQRKLELLKPGSTITVWYDRLNPKKSFLHSGLIE